MNELAEMPAATQPQPVIERPSASLRGNYALGLLIAVAVHAGVIFGWPKPAVKRETVQFDVESADSSVEVALVAAMPAEEPPVVQEVPPEPPPVEPPPPEPKPEPPPPEIVPDKPPEMTVPVPEPPKPTPPPRMAAKPKPKQTPAKPAPVARPSGDGSSPDNPGNDETTARVSAGAKSAKPGYMRNPHPSYPEEARAKGQQGTVSLFIKVDAAGHVVAVSVSRSSGFPLLDERARSTVASQWVFKAATAGGVPVASNVVIPIRFTLDR